MTELIVYLDSSAVAKRYVEEKGSDLVDRIYSGAETGGIQMAFSIWNVGEVLGVLDKYRAKRILSESEWRISFRNLALESTKMLRLGALIVCPITSDALVDSWVVSIGSHIYQADALQIVSARELGCGLLLTADGKLLEAAKSCGLRAFHVESQADEVREALEAG
jgi:predicted nucleic acid-binding protein